MLRYERETRIDPLTGETEQQCVRCQEWWFQTREFFYCTNGLFWPTCKACCEESRKRHQPIQRNEDLTKHLPVYKGFQPEQHWQRKRNGQWCTSRMFEVLSCLLDAKRQDWPAVRLFPVHKRTINSLLSRGWITISPGLDGARYSITSEGERAHRHFAKAPRRFDGICPTCGVRPKMVSASGTTYGYCKECEQKYRKFRNDKNLNRINPDRLCSCCHQRPLHRYSGGRLSTYCTECRHAQRKAEKRAQHDRDLERIRNGEVLLCRACKKEPRAYTERYVRDRCPACQKQYMDEYNARRRAKVQP